MDLCSKTRRERLHWPMATALALMLAFGTAFAGDDFERDERKDRTEEEPLSTENRCVPEPVAGKGTVRTEQRIRKKRDGTEVERRTRTIEQGQGKGGITLVSYSWKDERTLTTKAEEGRGPSKFISRHDERVIAQSDRVPSMFSTFELRIVGDEVTHVRQRCRCKKDDDDRFGTYTAPSCTAQP
jgi:hypothetical protein